MPTQAKITAPDRGNSSSSHPQKARTEATRRRPRFPSVVSLSRRRRVRARVKRRQQLSPSAAFRTGSVRLPPRPTSHQSPPPWAAPPAPAPAGLMRGEEDLRRKPTKGPAATVRPSGTSSFCFAFYSAIRIM